MRNKHYSGSVHTVVESTESGNALIKGKFQSGVKPSTTVTTPDESPTTCLIQCSRKRAQQLKNT